MILILAISWVVFITGDYIVNSMWKDAAASGIIIIILLAALNKHRQQDEEE
jgi:hypothetical protein